MEKKLKELIEDQINKELWSGYLYYNVAEFFRRKGLDGFHKWFMKHAYEECSHAERFSEFLQDREVEFVLKDIPAPKETFKDIKDALVFQVEHEKKVTAMIHNIYNEADKENNVAVKNFIQWYISEQLEEEKTAKDLLDDYNNYASDGSGLYLLNEKLEKEAK